MADLHFPSRREELTVLTQEQAAYISSKLDAQLVPGARRMLEIFVTSVSSWTQQF